MAPRWENNPGFIYAQAVVLLFSAYFPIILWFLPPWFLSWKTKLLYQSWTD